MAFMAHGVEGFQHGHVVFQNGGDPQLAGRSFLSVTGGNINSAKLTPTVLRTAGHD